jgi:anaerobic selenocysteine-containing dehydrogenase
MRAVQGYCGLCSVNCPIVTTVGDGEKVLSIAADPTHPFGGVICAKGRATPEFHHHPQRLSVPLRRTRPKTDPDPGWERLGWDEALDLIAAKMLQVRTESGAGAVAFAKGTSAGTGLTDTEAWLSRLTNHFGTPNTVSTTHLCQWPRDTGGAGYTFGTDRLAMPDVAHSGCIMLWGTNPGANFLSLGHDIATAKARGAKLVVVDPRRVGMANKADVFLQVRPGTDGALALSLIHLLITWRAYDAAFVRNWTNALYIVRDGELLPPDKDVSGETVFELLARQAAAYPPEVAERITSVPAERIEAAARLLIDNRPVSHYFHNGLVQHTNATQASRAIEVLYALIGDFDQPGGNVPGPDPRVNDIAGKSALTREQSQSRLGRQDRPAGPPVRPGNIAAFDLYQAVLEGDPYPVRALLAFGSNLLLANGDTLRGRAAVQKLEFFAQVELFETPTSRFADVLLPAADYLEAPALKLGYRYPVEAQAHVQRRPQVVEPLDERRGDVQIIFDLACRLGLGDRFWAGDLDAAFEYVLEPSGVTWDQLAEIPHGASLPRQPLAFRKYEARGFSTPTGKVELYSTTLAAAGYPPLPVYLEPAHSPVSTPEVSQNYPLILTNAKRATYLHSQHRALPSLRKIEPDPPAELHPTTAARYGIADRDWIVIETPSGSARARAQLSQAILPGVVCANHGWWAGCDELGLDAMDPYSGAGANVNLLILNDQRDPVSGGTPHRSSLCRVRKV